MPKLELKTAALSSEVRSSYAVNILQGLMAARQLIEGQLGEEADYVDEVDESLQVGATAALMTA